MRAASSGRKASALTDTTRLFLTGATETCPRKASMVPSMAADSPGGAPSSAWISSGLRGPPNSGSSRRFMSSITLRARARLWRTLYCVSKYSSPHQPALTSVTSLNAMTLGAWRSIRSWAVAAVDRAHEVGADHRLHRDDDEEDREDQPTAAEEDVEVLPERRLAWSVALRSGPGLGLREISLIATPSRRKDELP